ncbi:MAG: hypothetical protein GY729_16150 [Desulfobacteraceae bacterium]|nr:hypothetical protein [Desulfobacteraceae bacterium]
MKKNMVVFIVLTVVTIIFTILVNPGFGKTKPLKLALILWRGETQAEKGFKDGLNELGYSIKYSVFDAENKRHEFSSLIRSVKFEQYDYIYTFGTTATKMTKTLLKNKVPHIFNIVTGPVESEIVKSMDSTGGNISGASSKVPIQLQIENAMKVIQFKRLAVLFNPLEKNSMIIMENLKKLSNKFNFQVISLRSPPANQILEKNLQKLVDNLIDVDAVYLPSDSFIVSNASLIGKELRKSKIPSIGAIKKFIDQGAMIGTVVDYYTLGKMAATILDSHQKGKKLYDIPVQIQKDPVIVFNKTTIDLLNVKIAEELIKKAIIVQ